MGNRFSIYPVNDSELGPCSKGWMWQDQGPIGSVAVSVVWSERLPNRGYFGDHGRAVVSNGPKNGQELKSAPANTASEPFAALLVAEMQAVIVVAVVHLRLKRAERVSKERFRR